MTELESFTSKLTAILNGQHVYKEDEPFGRGPENLPVPKHGVERVGKLQNPTTRTLYVFSNETCVMHGGAVRAYNGFLRELHAKYPGFSNIPEEEKAKFHKLALRVDGIAGQLTILDELVDMYLFREFVALGGGLSFTLCTDWEVVAERKKPLFP